MKRLLLISLLLLAGCQSALYPRQDVIIFSKSLESGAGAWYAEASTRFERPVLVIGHGGRLDWDGQWCIFPDDGKDQVMVPIPMEWVARRLRDRFPGRPIVIISCNEQGDTLDEPGVFYATKLVWSWPMPSSLYTVGRIRDFVGKE